VNCASDGIHLNGPGTVLPYHVSSQVLFFDDKKFKIGLVIAELIFWTIFLEIGLWYPLTDVRKKCLLSEIVEFLIELTASIPHALTANGELLSARKILEIC
jgi:hypothetical protein